MFVLTTVLDTIRIPPSLLSLPTGQAIHNEIDLKYPNRVLMDVGLVVCRYGDCLQVRHGVCVAGDGGSHHECSFRLVVFRPFVEEVCIGRISKSTAEGLCVSLGFFDEIFIPAYWMLRPSRFEKASGLWVWTPQYDDDDDKGEDGNQVETNAKKGATVKKEDDASAPAQGVDEDSNRFEMELGAEIRFKVKSINFTQVTNTAKGMQATTTTTTTTTVNSETDNNNKDDSTSTIRQQSSSVGLDEAQGLPASMSIVASICEDGLGLVSWWSSPEEEEETEDVHVATKFEPQENGR